MEETQLPAAIHILVAMYAYATMISVTDIEAEQESMNYHGDTHADSLIENGKQQSKTYSFDFLLSFIAFLYFLLNVVSAACFSGVYP